MLYQSRGKYKGSKIILLGEEYTTTKEFYVTFRSQPILLVRVS